MTGFRTIALLTLLVGILTSCGSNESSLTDYAERLNTIGVQANRRGEELVVAAQSRGDDVTPQDIASGLELAGGIRLDIKEATDAIDPPDAISGLHNLIFDWHDRFILVEGSLATMAATSPDTDAGWTALSNSQEMADFRAAIAEGKAVCDDYQAELDATAERGVFADTPWIPSEMKEVVEVVVGCAWFPEDPATVYLWPPPESP